MNENTKAVVLEECALLEGFQYEPFLADECSARYPKLSRVVKRLLGFWDEVRSG